MTDLTIVDNYRHKYRDMLDQYLRLFGEDLTKYTNIQYGCSGESQQVDQFGLIKWREVQERMGKTNLQDAPTAIRYMRPRFFDAAIGFDKKDNVLTDGNLDKYMSRTVEAMKTSAPEQMCMVLVEALYGVNYTGKGGMVEERLDPDFCVPVDYNRTSTPVKSGMGTLKLLNGMTRLKTAKVWNDSRRKGGDELVIAIPASAKEDLLAEAERDKKETTLVRALLEGTTDRYCGFRFLEYEDLPRTEEGDIVCLAWVKSRVMFGLWEDVEIDVDKRNDLNNATQILGGFSCSASRLQRNAVLPILIKGE